MISCNITNRENDFDASRWYCRARFTSTSNNFFVLFLFLFFSHPLFLLFFLLPLFFLSFLSFFPFLFFVFLLQRTIPDKARIEPSKSLKPTRVVGSTGRLDFHSNSVGTELFSLSLSFSPFPPSFPSLFLSLSLTLFYVPLLYLPTIHFIFFFVVFYFSLIHSLVRPSVYTEIYNLEWSFSVLSPSPFPFFIIHSTAFIWPVTTCFPSIERKKIRLLFRQNKKRCIQM